jgi:hypothetical protein
VSLAAGELFSVGIALTSYAFVLPQSLLVLTVQLAMALLCTTEKKEEMNRIVE